MRIEVLFFEGCPHHRPAVELVGTILREQGVSANIHERNVPDEAAADRLRFLGSPTIRIDGLDIEPAARSSEEYGMSCRTYVNGGRREGLPSPELIRAAVREALARGAGEESCCAAGGPFHQKSDAGERAAWLTVGSVVAAVAASLCCILPIVFALTGITVAGAAAAFGGWRPYLLGLTFALLGLGYYFAYRPAKAECAPGSACAVPANRRAARLMLWVATFAVTAFAAFPYYSGYVADLLMPSSPPQVTAGEQHSRAQSVSFVIDGMDCGACATAIERRLKAEAGVREAVVSVATKKAEIRYDPASTNIQQLQKAIEEAGYHPRKS